MRVLIPVDGSKSALRAVSHVAETAGLYAGGVEVHLLNVQMPILSGNVRSFVGQDKLQAYYHDEGMAILEPACSVMKAANLPCRIHIGVGNVAQTILDYAREMKCDQICMGKGGMGAISGMLLGSVASRLIHISEIPLLLVH